MGDIPEKLQAAAPKALREALGQVIADLRREWRQERAVIESEARAVIAEAQGALTAARAELGALKVKHEATIELLKANAGARSIADPQMITASSAAAPPPPSPHSVPPGCWS